jgi:endonuclease/exonuclease/phosphatase family metal-dependent hydrolase
MGTRPSHCGYVDLLVRMGLTSTTTTTTGGDDDDARRRRRRPTATVIATERHGLPSVAATIEFPNGASVAVSSSHLAPFKDGAPDRLVQCATLMSLMSERADDCVLLGDFNARAAEDRGMEGSDGGGWTDAWKCAGSRTGDKFTWDSFANRYHGDEGFKFKARFDRCYVRGEALTVTRFGLMGNQRVDARVGDRRRAHFKSATPAIKVMTTDVAN